ncbi:VanZ family protein [Photobacterium sp. CCB-ST2H9]|uniref:VanZ family protein n=1 Tax=Photobacterium sp. CCB-ST2H9 TaxID=2912855 RepID=UPI00200564D6|nr:VanZ family protein [Photobacterium sp. CCB-ST2H9]UTM59934.1 VanZ family protein [Photobacterium sp. CCB-ST2H9]
MQRTQTNLLYQEIKIRKLQFFALALFWGHGFLITWLTLMPPAEKGALTDLKSYGIAHLDFILHAMCYGLFAGYALLISKHLRRYSYMLLLLVLYGSFLETIQSMVQPGRESSVSDAIANLTGVVLGGVISWSLMQTFMTNLTGTRR